MTQCGQYIDSRKFLSAERSAVEFSTARWHAKVKTNWNKRKKNVILLQSNIKLYIISQQHKT